MPPTGESDGAELGQRISGLTVDGPNVRAAVFDEHQVRAAAGLTMVLGAVAFAFAYFEQQYLPLQIVTAVFFVEFLIRLTFGLRYSPVGLVARVHDAPRRTAGVGLGQAQALRLDARAGDVAAR